MPGRGDDDREPNTELSGRRRRMESRVRRGQCMSRAEVADAVNAALDRLYPGRILTAHYVDSRWVGKLERGEHHWSSDERRAALRDVFGVATDIEIGLYVPRRTEDVLADSEADERASAPRLDSPRRTPAPRNHDRSVVAAARGRVAFPSAVGGGRHPSLYVPFQPAALDRPALDWLQGVEANLPARTADGRPVGAGEVEKAARRLHELREQDHQLGAGAVAPLVTAFINDTLWTLLTGACEDPRLRERVFTIAVGARELAGYQAVDRGADGVGQRHYLHALSLTSVAGDRAYGAYLLGVSLGHLALHCGHADRGLRMAQIALTGLPPDASPAVRAGLWAVAARSYARLGDEPGCTVALRTAETNLASPAPRSDPGWITYLTPAYLADEVAHCMFDLDRHETARREVRRAVNGLSAARVRRRAIDTALLASSLAAVARVDEACAHGRDAVDLAARTQSARAVQRVAQVRADLIPYEDSRVVRELVDYIHTTLPAAL